MFRFLRRDQIVKIQKTKSEGFPTNHPLALPIDHHYKPTSIMKSIQIALVALIVTLFGQNNWSVNGQLGSKLIPVVKMIIGSMDKTPTASPVAVKPPTANQKGGNQMDNQMDNKMDNKMDKGGKVTANVAPTSPPSSIVSDVPSGLKSDSVSDTPSSVFSDVPSSIRSDATSDVPSFIRSDATSDTPSDASSDFVSDAPSIV
jgi:hypothetical protein